MCVVIVYDWHSFEWLLCSLVHTHLRPLSFTANIYFYIFHHHATQRGFGDSIFSLAYHSPQLYSVDLSQNNKSNAGQIVHIKLLNVKSIVELSRSLVLLLWMQNALGSVIQGFQRFQIWYQLKPLNRCRPCMQMQTHSRIYLKKNIFAKERIDRSK